MVLKKIKFSKIFKRKQKPKKREEIYRDETFEESKDAPIIITRLK